MPDDTKRSERTPSPPDLRSLRHLAFERNDAAAYQQWRALEADAQRAALLDRDTLRAVLAHAAHLLDTAGAAGRPGQPDLATRIQRRLLEACTAMEAGQLPFTSEWFRGIERWADALVEHHRFDLAEQALRIAYRTGANRFAGTHQALRATEARLLATTGRSEEAAHIAVRYALRPYLLPDRRLRPQIYRRLMAALVLAGRMAQYRSLLWRGLSDVYFDGDTRAWFVQQARITYRGYLRTLAAAEVPLSRRLQFGLRVVSDAMSRWRLVRWLRLDRALYWANFSVAYYLAYGRAQRRLLAPPPRRGPALDRTLVTRAMGGIGDLLMMTPGLHARCRADGGTPIALAVPRGYFALFEGNPDVECVDIESADLDPAAYRAWYDLTDCPAARVEARQQPNVRSDRVQIFASALGVARSALASGGAAPRYTVTDVEAAAARALLARVNPEGRRVVGIQLHSAESYRDYPHMAEVAAHLARDCCVLLFDALPIAGFDGPGLHKIVLPLRASFAVAAACDVLIAPDSSFVHLGAALRKPVVAIFGPISGAVRCRRFPTVSVVAPAPREFRCSPCWRHEYSPCRLTGLRESACLRAIEPRLIVERARRLAGIA